jgi:hypothetical protein
MKHPLKIVLIYFLCPLLSIAQFDDMKALGISQVNPSDRFSESIGEGECEIAIWIYTKNRKDSSLMQERITKKYNSDGSPTLISFSNGKPRFELEYDTKLLTKVVQHGDEDNPFIQIFRIDYDETSRITKYERSTLEDDGKEIITAWNNYVYIHLTDSTDSVHIESKYGPSSLIRTYNKREQLTAFAHFNGRGYLLDEGTLSYKNDILIAQTVIRHNSNSEDLVENFTYSDGRLDQISGTKNGELIEKETFTYSDSGRLTFVEHFRSWRSLNRHFHTYK